MSMVRAHDLDVLQFCQVSSKLQLLFMLTWCVCEVSQGLWMTKYSARCVLQAFLVSQVLCERGKGDMHMCMNESK